MKSPITGVVISIAFLLGASLATVAIDEPPVPEPVVLTEYIFIPPSTISIAPYESDEPAVEKAALPIAVEVVQPQSYYTFDEFMEVIALTPWPDSEWQTVWELSSGCEAVGTDENGTPRIAARAIGDNGLSYGALQIRRPSWPRYARSYDLLDLRQNLLAGHAIWLEVGREYSPTWSCAR